MLLKDCKVWFLLVLLIGCTSENDRRIDSLLKKEITKPTEIRILSEEISEYTIDKLKQNKTNLEHIIRIYKPEYVTPIIEILGDIGDEKTLLILRNLKGSHSKSRTAIKRSIELIQNSN